MLFSAAGFLPALGSAYFGSYFWWRLGVVAFITTVIETIPTSKWYPLDDNVSVPLAAALLSYGLLGM